MGYITWLVNNLLCGPVIQSNGELIAAYADAEKPTICILGNMYNGSLDFETKQPLYCRDQVAYGIRLAFVLDSAMITALSLGDLYFRKILEGTNHTRLIVQVITEAECRLYLYFRTPTYGWFSDGSVKPNSQMQNQGGSISDANTDKPEGGSKGYLRGAIGVRCFAYCQVEAGE